MSAWKENRFGVAAVAGICLLNLGVLGVVGTRGPNSYEDVNSGAPITTDQSSEQARQVSPPSRHSSERIETPRAPSSDPVANLPSPASKPADAPSQDAPPSGDTAPQTDTSSSEPSTDATPAGPSSTPADSQTEPDSQSKPDDAPVVIPIPAQGPGSKTTPETQAPTAPTPPAVPTAPTPPASLSAPGAPATGQ